MANEERYEPLSAENEYEGLQWIGGEAFYRTKKKKRTETSEDRIYGIFADNHSSDEETKSNKNQIIGGRKRADYSKPVNFISRGQYQPGIEEKNESEEETEEEEEEFFKKIPKNEIETEFGMNDDKYEVYVPKVSELPENDILEEKDILPTSFGRKIKEAAALRQKKEREDRELSNAWKTARNAGFAEFEKHSSGIASKLMQKMGYKPGEGLGKNKQGVVAPLEQRLRPKSMGMGYNDFKEQTQNSNIEQEITIQEFSGRKTMLSLKPRYWKQKFSNERKSRNFKSAEDIIKENEELNATEIPAVSSIIDMRGPRVQVITNFEELDKIEKSEEMDQMAACPELQHNMKLAIDLAEADIRNVDSKLKQKQDATVVTGREQARMEKKLEGINTELESMNYLNRELKEIGNLDILNSAKESEGRYMALLQEYKKEFTMYNIGMLILRHVLPYFDRLFFAWNSLTQPTHGIEEVCAWKHLLEPDSLKSAIFENVSAMSTDPFSLLLCQSQLPRIRLHITNFWDPTNPNPLLKLVETWCQIWPKPYLNHICSFLILGRLKARVEVWEPRKEVIAIHRWLHPWLPIMGEKMKELYPTILYKMISALHTWCPSDSSAYVLISPWKSVFDSKDWDLLLSKSIIPKLAQALQEMEINPVNQDMRAFDWLMLWKDMIPIDHTVSLLQAIFFPKWLQILHYWLSHNPNYEEVSNWYLNWKNMIPENIREHEQISEKLGIALNLMSTAVDGSGLPPLQSLTNVYTTNNSIPNNLPVFTTQPQKSIFTLRDLIQKFAEENNIEFAPKPGRLFEGLQVYGFGSISVILDNSQNTVRAQISSSKWIPVTLLQLLEQYHAKNLMV